MRDVVERRVEIRLNALESLIDWLVDNHAALVDETDFDPLDQTRPAAAWLVAGRALSLSRALLVLLRAGVASETAPTARALHETARLLQALLDRNEPDILDKFLADEWTVRPSKLSAAERRGQDRMVEEMIPQGVAPPERTDEITKKVYDDLSKDAHPTLGGIRADYTAELRRFAYVPHHEPVARAAWVLPNEELMVEALLSVGLMLAKAHGPAFFAEVEAGIRELREVQAQQPIAQAAPS